MRAIQYEEVGDIGVYSERGDDMLSLIQGDGPYTSDEVRMNPKQAKIIGQMLLYWADMNAAG